MAGKYTVALAKLIHDNGLEVVFMPNKPQEELLIRSQDVNRPGLMFAGYGKHFDPERLEFLGDWVLSLIVSMIIMIFILNIN